MNRLELRDKLSFVLNNNDGQVNQDFSTARLNSAIDWAYKDEVRQAKLEGGENWFKMYADVAWASGTLTMALMPMMDKNHIIEITDITHEDPGPKVLFNNSELMWVNRYTLQWGSDGPPEDKTLRFFYLAQPVSMVGDLDEPELIPPEFHEIVVWSAAVLLSDIADDSAPSSWARRLNNLREDLYKYLSKGRPLVEGNLVSHEVDGEDDL